MERNTARSNADDTADRTPHDSKRGSRRNVFFTIVRFAFMGVAAIVVLAVLAIFALTNSDWGREQVRVRAVSILNGVAHGHVTIGKLSGNLLRELTLHDVTITDSSGAPFVSASEVAVNFKLRALVSRKIDLSNVRLDHANIVLDQRPGSEWNYLRIFPSDSTPSVDTAGIQFGDWVVLHDARISNSNLSIRASWEPDSKLSTHTRDSLINAALDPSSRTLTTRIDGGYQRVQEFHHINGVLPLVRIAHPEHSTRLVIVDSLRVTAFAFAPPPAEVQQARGKVEIDGDSVWFDFATLQLPSSNATVNGRYTFASGDLLLHTVAKPAALADIRFVYPPLPNEGRANVDLTLTLEGASSTYAAQGLDLRTGSSTVTGDVGITIGDTIKWMNTNVQFANVSTALIEKLVPGVKSPRKGAMTGSAQLDGPMTSMRVDGDVTFLDSQTGRNRVTARGMIGIDSNSVRARNLMVTFNPVQVDLAQDAVKDLPVHGIVTGRATLNGSTDTLLHVDAIDLVHVDRDARSHIAGSGAFRNGTRPFVALDARADSLSLITLGRFAPAAELRGSVAGPIRVNGTTDALSVDISLASSDSGLFSAKGVLDVASDEMSYDAQVTTRLLNARTLSNKAPRTSLSAEFTARGKGFDPATMSADVSVHVSTSTIDTLAVDSSHVRARISSGVINVDTFAIRVPGASADIAGTFGLTNASNGTLTYHLQVDSARQLARYLPLDTTTVFPRPGIVAERIAMARADSANISQKLMVARAAGVAPPAAPVAVQSPSGLKADSIAGKAVVDGTITGNIESIDIEGKAHVERVAVLGNTVVRAHAEFFARQLLTSNALVDASVAGDSIMASGFALDSVNAHATYRVRQDSLATDSLNQSSGGDARISVFQNSSREYAMNAGYSIFPDRKEIRIDSLRFRFDSTMWSAQRRASIHFGKPGIEVDSLDLRNGKGGRIFADGTLPEHGAADFKVAVVDFEVGDLMGVLQSDVGARGRLSVNSNVAGTGAQPIIDGSVKVMNGMLDETIVPDIVATYNYADQKLNAKATATLNTQQLAVADAQVPINLALSGVSGSRLLDSPSAITVKADSLPLDLVGQFTDAISSTRGAIVGQGALAGPIRKPTLSGKATVTGAQMRVNALGVLLTAVNGAVHLAGDSVVIDSLAASSDGRLIITGSLGIAKPAEPSFDLHVVATNARVLDNDIGKARADADITVKGPFDGVAVNGRARIREGVLYVPKTDTREPIATNDALVVAAADTTADALDDVLPTESPLIANLRMNLRLAVDRDTWVRSKEANVEIFSDGDLRIVVNQRRNALTLDGVLNSDRGEYEFMSKRFQIKRGSVTFTGGGKINPLLQLTGEYDLKQASQQALKIRVLIGGTMLDPRLTLESDAQPPISQSDLLSYLAFGSESGSLLQFGSSSVSGGTAGGGLVGTSAALATKQLTGVALGVAVDELEGQAARTLGADVFNITPANIPPELASGNFGKLSTFFKGTQLEFGKYFSTQTFVGLQLQATDTPGFRVEYRFRKHQGLSLESTLQPRFFLPEPSLEPQDLRKANAFGLFLIRRWRF